MTITLKDSIRDVYTRCLHVMFTHVCKTVVSRSINIQERGLRWWFPLRENNFWLVFRHSQTDLLQTRCDDRHYLSLQFDTSMNELDFHPKPQLMRKQKLLISFCRKISQFVWMKICAVFEPVSLLKLIVNLFCTISIQGREPFLGGFVKCALNTCCCWMLLNNFLQAWYDD